MKRILYLEDNKYDSELLSLYVKFEFYNVTIKTVDNYSGFIEALNSKEKFHLIICDYKIHNHKHINFDGLKAVILSKEKRPDVPVIFITGSEAYLTILAKQTQAEYIEEKKDFMDLVSLIRKIFKDERRRKSNEQS